MNETLFQEFKAIFDDDFSSELQQIVYHHGISEYIDDPKSSLISHNPEEKRYYYFYAEIKSCTGRERRRKKEIIAKENEGDIDYLVIKKHYTNSINKSLLNGRLSGDFHFVIYYWFHVYCTLEKHALKIDEQVLAACPKNDYPEMARKLNEIKLLLKKEALIVKAVPPKSQVAIKLSAEPSLPTSLSLINTPPTFTAEQWLNPLNQDAIPFVGRAQEIEHLNAFARDDRPFLIWGIVGPSGAGKTRLYNAWRFGRYSIPEETSVVKDWHQRILSTSDKDDWKNWQPEAPTLLIIDYLFGLSETFNLIIKRCKQGFPHKVRLLLVDHVFPDNLESLLRDPRWGLTHMDGSEFDLIRPLFFLPYLLRLAGEYSKDQSHIIETILRTCAGGHPNESIINKAKDYLKSQKNAWHPLFAALVGDAIQKNRPYQAWNRRQLIYHYLEGSKRLPWKQEGITGQIASAFVAAATARRGVPFELLQSCVPSDVEQTLHKYTEIQNVCKRIVSEDFEKILPPYEPDILGESFFLLFISDLKALPRVIKSSFIQMLSQNFQANDVLEFIAFIKRLTRNLSSDPPEEVSINEFWKCLFDFLQPDKFSTNAQMLWAISVAIIEVFDRIKRLHPQEAKQLLNSVDVDILLDDQYSDLLAATMFSAMAGHINISANTQKLYRMDQIYEDSQSGIRGQTALMWAAYKGHEFVVEALIAKAIDVNEVDRYGQTALILAAISGQARVARLLIENGANIEHFDGEGRTALMCAANRSREEVIRLLIEKGAEVDKANNDNTTALSWAAAKGQERGVKVLIEKGADVNKGETGTALMWAAYNHKEAMIQLLIDNGAEVNKVDHAGQTALMWAAGFLPGGKPVVQALIANGADVNKADNQGRTALMEAVRCCDEEVTQCLIANGADVNKADNQGRTALIETIQNVKTQVEITKWKTNLITGGFSRIYALLCALDRAENYEAILWSLIDSGAEINKVDGSGQTALNYAKIIGHEPTIQILIEKGAIVV